MNEEKKQDQISLENIKLVKKRNHNSLSKKNKYDSKDFANAFSTILKSKIKAHKKNNPILIRCKNTINKVNTFNQEVKLKKILRENKKIRLQSSHRIKLYSNEDEEKNVADINREREMRLEAQKGVVRLFNIILSSRNKVFKDGIDSNIRNDSKNEFDKISKEDFLELMQSKIHD